VGGWVGGSIPGKTATSMFDVGGFYYATLREA